MLDDNSKYHGEKKYREEEMKSPEERSQLEMRVGVKEGLIERTVE